ncbi:magnesium/cobalt transporter CorA [Candidatus Woesearchaeota archaeon]|nr:magnesium/cobalt transporter CorA [Candidatus Woesearchaeota archaeon]
MLTIHYLDKMLKTATSAQLPKIKNKRLWIDATSITHEEAKLLQDTFDLHPLTTEDMLHSKTRIKIEEFNNYLFCVFYGIQKNETISMMDIDFAIGANFVISNHEKEIPTTTALLKDSQRAGKLLQRGPDFLFHWMLNQEIENFFPVLEEIDIHIEALEEQVTKKPHPKIMEEILRLKRQLTEIKKIAFHQREKTSYLAKNEHRFITRKSIPYFRDAYDHTIRVSDTVDNYREAVANTFDVYMSSVSNNMNEVMKVLSIFATIALPLTAISSIYGTNFVHLPGSQFQYGFWVMILAMLALSIVMLFYFKKKEWF